MITIMRDYKRHTCTRDIPSILYPDYELYYIYNGHISIHNREPSVLWTFLLHFSWVMAETWNMHSVEECAFNDPNNVQFCGKLVDLYLVHTSSREVIEYFDTCASTATATALRRAPFDLAHRFASNELQSVEIRWLPVACVWQCSQTIPLSLPRQ
jgi:hypothetical protein